MLTHPYLMGFAVKQHIDDLMVEAEHHRVLTAALRRRREARAAAKAARHAHDSLDNLAAPAALPTPASVKSGNLRPASAGSPRDRFSSDQETNLSAWEHHEAA